MPDEPEGAGPPGEPEGDLTARLRRLEQRGTPIPRPPVRSTPWPVSDAPVPPPSPDRPVVETPQPPAVPAAVAVPAPAAVPVAADDVPEPGSGDRVVTVLVLLAVLLLAAAAGLGAAALVEHQLSPTDRDAWVLGALAAGIVLALAGIAARLRRPRRL